MDLTRAYYGPYAYTTATVKVTLTTKCVSFLLWNFALITVVTTGLVCLSVFKLAPSEYTTNAFNSKLKKRKLAVVAHVLQTMKILVISRCCFAEDGKEIYQ